MKFKILMFLLLSVIPNLAFSQLVWFGKTMPPMKAETLWGKDVFDSKRFKEADMRGRSKMAASLVRKKKDWIGKPLKDVRAELGSHDGFYFSDHIPAYLIQEGKSQKEESWQVVFLPDIDNKIKEIVIHKNCCE